VAHHPVGARRADASDITHTGGLIMEPRTVISAYNVTDEAADGLALSHLLATMTDGELLVVRVLRDLVEHPAPDLAQQRLVRDRMADTRRAIVATIPDDADDELMPVLDPSLARGLHEAARRCDASFLVLGSTHHGHLGRLLLGGSADLILGNAPCPVAVAPPGFRDRAELDPPVIGVADDGSSAGREAHRLAADLARAAGVPLRVIAVAHGDPARALIAESERLGMLVMGTRGYGGARRALVGSASRRVVHEAACPVIVVPHPRERR
jgi:nucleotide-binding universal stress UspA family protein